MTIELLFLHENSDGALIDVLVVARSSRSAIVGVHGDRLKVAVHAAPVDGAANEAVGELIAELFGVPKSAVTITQGQTSKRKTVQIYRISKAAARGILEKALSGG